MNFKDEMEQKTALVDKALNEFMLSEETYPESIHKAMRYSLFSGGKRLRPILVLASTEALGGNPEHAMSAACALELIHTYSLIHDDLPAMDDDDYRRGRLTCHKVFGDAIGVLAGDALLTYAFEILTRTKAPAEQVLQVIKEMSIAAGTLGMIGGQVVDMESEQKQIEAETLHYIHTRKTGALYKAAVRSGGILAGAKSEDLDALTNYAENLGLAFQITDDILDIEGDEKIIGKPVGSDLRNQKSTYPSLYGLAKAKEMAAQAVDNAILALEPYGEKGWMLKEIAKYLLVRTH